MDFKININAIIPALTLLQGLTFATLLILRGRREERHSDFWLASLLILLGLTGVPFMLGWLGITYLWEELTFLPWDGLGFASVPTIYLFLRSLVNSEWRFSWRRDGKHYALYAFYFIYHLAIGGYGQIDKNFVNWWWHSVEGLAGVVILWDMLNYGQELFYFILCYRLYKEYRAWTFNEFSDVERVSYRWFYNFLVVHFSVVVVQFFNDLWLRLVNYSYAQMWAIYITELILVYYISISGYAQARVKEVHFTSKTQVLPENTYFPPQNEQNMVRTLHQVSQSVMAQNALTEGMTDGVVTPLSDVKIAETEATEAEIFEKTSDLSTNNVDNFDESELFPQNEILEKNEISANSESKAVRDVDLAHWKHKVLTYFEKEKAYLNPELTLSELASKLGTNTSVLSAVINTGFGKNFNDFVNEYRVEAFKRKAAAPDSKHLTLLAIAFDCGFNSKATFNRAFKKVTDVSPKAFLDLT